MDHLYVPSKHQAAGHDGCLISPEDGALFLKLTTQQEIDFYTNSQLLQENDPNESSLLEWMPLYLGTLVEGNITKQTKELVVLPTDENIVRDKAKDKLKYVVLENLYYGLKNPSILDIKLGSLLTDSSASPDKKERLRKVSESTTSGSLNFRICGMKLYIGDKEELPEEIYPGMHEHIKLYKDEKEGNYLEFSKFYGRSLTKETIKDGLRLMFTTFLSDESIILKLLNNFLKRLQLLYNCLLDCEVRIISGSLLFIYENNPQRWEKVLENEEEYELLDPIIADPLLNIDDDSDDDDDKNIEKESTYLSRLSFIDFAHAKYVKGQGYDENIIIGVENLITIFEELIRDSELKLANNV